MPARKVSPINRLRCQSCFVSASASQLVIKIYHGYCMCRLPLVLSTKSSMLLTLRSSIVGRCATVPDSQMDCFCAFKIHGIRKGLFPEPSTTRYIRPASRRFSWIIISVSDMLVEKSHWRHYNKLTIHGCHDETDLHGVRRACEMGVNLLSLVLVQADEAVEDVVTSGGVIWATLVIWEVVFHWAHWELLLETVDLVEEEDDTGLDEPARIADAVEESQSFLHTVDRLVFEEELVIFGDSHQEEDSGDVLEAVNPLLTLRSLSTNVKHSVGEVANNESSLGDTSRLDSRSENILVIGDVVGLSDAVYRIEVAGNIRVSM